MKQTQNNSFDSQQVLSVIEQYSTALDLLDAYDHQTMERPKGNEAAYVLTYEECMHVIACMRFGKESEHLLYFVTKNHSFFDRNKRIAAAMFLYFLDKNGALLANGQKTIDDHTLVALTIMIAESRPDEMEMMITVVMNCMKK